MIAGTGGRYEVITDMSADMSVPGSDVAVRLSNRKVTRVHNDEISVCQSEVGARQYEVCVWQYEETCVSPRKALAVRSTNGSATRVHFELYLGRI